jgi:AraC-like DNA-binding protein
MSSAAARQVRQKNPVGTSALLAQGTQAFPNVYIRLRDSGERRSLTSCTIAGHPISRLVTPHTTVDACGKRSTALGFQDQFKLLWQLSGTMRFEDGYRSLTLSAGEMIVVPMAQTYRLEMGEDYEGLALIFDPATSPRWREIAHREMIKVIGASGAIAAAAAAAAALLRHASGDRADALAVRSLIDLALTSLEGDDETSLRLPPRLHRAHRLIDQNIRNAAYGPDALAKDLGVSRRSLYGTFGRLGLSPAVFIRRQRLEHARNEILNDQDHQVSLTAIALENGFPDSSSFSHAFKAVYGVAPSALRARRRPI